MPPRNARTAGELDAHIGSNIRKIRILRGLRLEEIAVQCDLSWQQISKYETGHSRVSVSTLHRIAAFVDVPMSYFFAGLEDPQSHEPIPYPDIPNRPLDSVAKISPNLQVALGVLISAIAEDRKK